MTQVKTVIKGFETSLHVLINNFGRSVIPLILRVAEYGQARLIKSKTVKTHSKIQNTAVDDITRILDRAEMEEINEKLRPILRRYTRQSYNRGVNKGVRDLNKIGIQVEFMLLPRDYEAVELMVGNDFSLVNGATGSMKKDMLRVLSIGMLEGRSIPEMSRELRKGLSVTKHRADMIARTETHRAYNHAALNKYKDNGISKWRWITAGDDRVRESHAQLDGQVFKMDDPAPPTDPNCRCTVVPFISEARTPRI